MGYANNIKIDENRVWTVLAIVIVVTWFDCNNIVSVKQLIKYK